MDRFSACSATYAFCRRGEEQGRHRQDHRRHRRRRGRRLLLDRARGGGVARSASGVHCRRRSPTNGRTRLELLAGSRVWCGLVCARRVALASGLFAFVLNERMNAADWAETVVAAG